MENDSYKRLLISAKAFALGLLLCISGFFAQRAYAAEEREVFAYILDIMEINPAAACGIMGNIKAESDFNPGITGLGAGFGLCQWTGARTSRLHTYCASNGMDAASAKGQISFAYYELKNYYPHVYSYLKSVPNSAYGAYQAAYYWCMHYEIPADRVSASAYRAAIARDTYWPSMGALQPHLSAAVNGEGILLTWNASGSSYAVKRASSIDGKYKTVATVKGGRYTDTTTKKQRRYYYYVARLSGKTETVRSNKVGITNNRTLNDPACHAELSKDSYQYNGKARTPSVTVRYNREKLKSGRDYKVTWSDNTQVGKGKALIQGIGRYSGTVTKVFRITKAEAVISVKDIETEFREGLVIAPKVRIKNCREGSWKAVCRNRRMAVSDGQTLKIRKPGRCTVRVKLTGTDNYKAETVSLTLTILPRSVKIQKAVRKDGQIQVVWDKEECSGYQIRYDSRPPDDSSPVKEIPSKKTVKTVIPASIEETAAAVTGEAQGLQENTGQEASGEAQTVQQTVQPAGTDPSVPAGETAAASPGVSREVVYVQIRSFVRDGDGPYVFGEWSRKVKIS